MIPKLSASYSIVFPKLHRSIILQDRIGKNKLPSWFRIRNNNLPPNFILTVDGTKQFVKGPAALYVSCGVPDVNLL